MALKFNPFENDKPASMPIVGRFSKLRVFDESSSKEPEAEKQGDEKKGLAHSPTSLVEEALKNSKRKTKFHDLLEDPPPSSSTNLFDSNSIIPLQSNSNTQKEELTTNPQQTDNKPITKWQQTDNKPITQPITKWQQTDNKLSAKTFKKNKTDNKPITQPITQPITKWQQTDNKPITKTSFSALVGLQRAIILFLYEDTKNSRSRLTQFLTLEHISESVNTTPGAAKMTLHRLERKGCIVRVDFKNGRGGRSQYELTDSVYNEVIRYETANKPITKWQQTDNKVVPQPITQPITDLPSSSSLLKTTTTEGEVIEKLRLAVDRFDLHKKKIDLNDLIQIWRKGVFKTADEFLISVEHAAFYLHSPQANTIERPKGWFYSNLSKGFFAPPTGFISWEEKQLEAQAKAIREKAERIRIAKEKLIQDEFEIWLAETPEEEKIKFLRTKNYDGRVDSPIARIVLNDLFLEKRGEGGGQS